MDKKNKGTLFDSLWGFLSSIKLAIVAFALIAGSSIVGTLIEQGAPYEKNVEIIGALVGHSMAPAVYRALEAMGFMDMYHSWWFTSFLLLFCLNIIICSIDRFPPIWKLINEPLKPLGEEHFKGFPIMRELSFKGKPEKVREALKALRFDLKESEDKGEVQYYGQKGRYSRLGVYVTHMSIIVVMIGALIGIFFGFSGFLNLPEGAAYSMAFGRVALTEEEFNERNMIINIFQQKKGDLDATAAALGVDVPRLEGRMKSLGIELLDFIVRCEDFEVKFYGNSDMPKEYTSHLTVYDRGRKAMDKWIEVNDPLKYKGYYFYQSSYGVLDETETFIYKMLVTSKSGQKVELSLRHGETFTIPGTSIKATIKDFSPALSFDANGRAFTYSDMMNNPAVKLEINDGQSTYEKWFLRRYPNTWYLTDGHTIQPVDIWGTQYTGLQVRKDPGVLTVYFGCLLMSVGLFMAFFMSHRRIWVRVKAEKGGTKVLIAASANKNKEGFQRKIDSLASQLSEGGK